MQDYQEEFLDFSVETNVLRFGSFMLKSGRQSPYFFNSGLFNTGGSLARLGRFYAQAIEASGIDYDMLFGPAYKGIPIAAATSIALADQHHKDIPYAFNRKEAKDHGEGGVIVGAELNGRILVIDDVISAGTSVRESVDIIRAQQAQLAGVVISLDRQERGQNETSAIQEVEASYGIRVASIVTLADLITYLESKANKGDELAAIRDYREQYGVA